MDVRSEAHLKSRNLRALTIQDVTMAQWKSKVWKIYCLAMGSNLVPNYGGRSSPKLGLLEERKKLAVVL